VAEKGEVPTHEGVRREYRTRQGSKRIKALPPTSWGSGLSVLRRDIEGARKERSY